MDFDKPKVYGDTSITDGLVFASTNKKLKVGKKESRSLFGLPLKCVWVKVPKGERTFSFSLVFLFHFCFDLKFEKEEGVLSV